MRALGAVGLSLVLAGCLELNPDFGSDAGRGSGSATSSGGQGSSSDGASFEGGSPDGTSSEAGSSTDSDGSEGGSADGSDSTGEPSGDCFAAWHEEGWSMSPPILIPAINSEAFEVDPFVSLDGSILYFSSARNPTGYDVFKAVRPDVDAPFELVEFGDDFNSPANDVSFSPLGNELSVVFTSDRVGSLGGHDVWMATRASLDAEWELGRIEEINTDEHEFDAALSEDGLRIYWAVSGSSPDNLYFAERPDLDSPFGERQLLVELESSDYDDSPRLSPDETIVVFGSARTVPESLGDHDIWYAVRSDRSLPFDEPRLVPDVNSMHREGEARLFHDGCGLYFISSDPAGVGGWDIYESRIVR